MLTPVEMLQIEIIHSASAIGTERVSNSYSGRLLALLLNWTGQLLLPFSQLEFESLLKVQVARLFNHIRQVAPTATKSELCWALLHSYS